MRCYQIRAQLSAYIDGELDTATAKHLASHLGQCPQCQEALKDLQGLDDELRRLPRVDLGPEFFSRVSTTLGEDARYERADLREALPAEAKPSRWADIVDSLFGAGGQSSNDALDEFSDFPPLSISSAYFTVLGRPEN